MAYGLHIGVLVSNQLAELDEIGAELLFVELLGLAEDPYRGTEVRRVGDRSRRMLTTGRQTAIVFEVDEAEKSVTVVDLVDVSWT